MSESMTREQLLALAPDAALEAAFRPVQGDLGTAGAACYEQMRAAGVPIDALDLCIAAWSQALEDLPPGPVPVARLDRLDADLDLQASGLPVLGRWMDALRRPVGVAHDLDRAIQFLLRVRTTWLLAERIASR